MTKWKVKNYNVSHTLRNFYFSVVLMETVNIKDFLFQTAYCTI